jgi:putative nucleotidyltransferase with HDIG domain
MEGLPTRDEALTLLKEHMKEENLLRHCYAVESGMRGMAHALGEDVQLWRIAGLLHDLDYEEYPDDHPKKSMEWLTERGLPRELVHAVAAHAGERTGVEKESKLDWALFGVDELTGLVVTTALVMPTKRLAEVKAKSVKKKMKDKAFARAVNRQAIHDTAEALGMDLAAFIAVVLTAMQGDHESLGL